MGKTVRTVCQGCHSECCVLVHVDEGKVTGIEPDPNHPSSRVSSVSNGLIMLTSLTILTA